MFVCVCSHDSRAIRVIHTYTSEKVTFSANATETRCRLIIDTVKNAFVLYVRV